MKKLKNRIGMTMAEMLMVVAIVVVLCGVAFVGVWNYQRTLGQLERDGIAKEIFIAAQNHLTAAYGGGYLGTTEFGKRDEISVDENAKDIEDDYYFVVNGNIAENSALAQMLPFGSVDETVRVGGSYIIRYQKNTGMVLDVFYCTRSGSPSSFNHELTEGDYNAVLALRDTSREDHKEERKDWKDGSILGWYGGEEAATLPQTSLKTPKIKIHNEEKLYVEVDNPNAENSNALIKLLITGVTSKAKKAYQLEFGGTDTDARVISNSSSKFYVLLDDIADVGTHFGSIVADTEITGQKFIPGEDITVQAVSYSTTALTNVAYSAKNTTNSIFGSISSTRDKAYIGNIRHLENLDRSISKYDTENQLNIAAAEQTDSFSWTEYQKAVKRIETTIKTGVPSESGYGSVSVYGIGESTKINTETGYYIPIEPDYALTYDGKHHSISDVAVNTTGAGGLFGAVSTVSRISNLELIDFSVKSTASAGALAGTVENGCKVTNVLARNKDNSEASLSAKISGKVNAGGLIGKLISGTVQHSGAAVIVEGEGYAGGLIGDAVDGEITGCYSGGHTSNGSYAEWVSADDRTYDVTGATAGGLVGNSAVAINDSYSTCSVSGSKAAGFAASAASGEIKNCYASGYIDPSATTKFAFLADGSATLSGNYYYRAINEIPKEGGKEDETEPMPPYPDAAEVSGHIEAVKPLDLNADVYNDFTGASANWYTARAFDPALVQYYSGKYPLKTVQELNDKLPKGYDNWNQLYVMTHYGDWPSPEVFFINN